MNRADIVALVYRQARAWESRDVHAIGADFAAKGVLISPSGHWIGPTAICEAAEAFFAHAADIRISVTRILIVGLQVAIEWTWSETDRVTG